MCYDDKKIIVFTSLFSGSNVIPGRCITYQGKLKLQIWAITCYKMNIVYTTFYVLLFLWWISFCFIYLLLIQAIKHKWAVFGTLKTDFSILYMHYIISRPWLWITNIMLKKTMYVNLSVDYFRNLVWFRELKFD